MFMDAKNDATDGSRVKLYKKVNNDPTQFWRFIKVSN
jgi:hypothetical protein